jgi:hypothetical protein
LDCWTGKWTDRQSQSERRVNVRKEKKERKRQGESERAETQRRYLLKKRKQ